MNYQTPELYKVVCPNCVSDQTARLAIVCDDCHLEIEPDQLIGWRGLNPAAYRQVVDAAKNYVNCPFDNEGVNVLINDLAGETL